MYEYYFSDQWFFWLWNNFSILILLGLGLLKIVAIIYPGTKTNQILDLIQGLMFRTRPAAKAKDE